MNGLTDAQLQQIRDRIVKALEPERIVLFGSYAYGEPTRDSDVDLLIIMESDERPARRAARVSRLFRHRVLPMDILVRTPQEVQRRLQIGDPFMQEILERGKLLYERVEANGEPT